jgi:hypothetical protein
MIRRTLLALIALVFVAGASACGGGGDGGDDAADSGDQSSDAGGGGEEAGGDTTDTAGSDDVSTQLGVDREFTGEGSEPFCTEVAELQQSDANNPAAVDDATFAGQMAAIEPPPEIEAEWTNLYTVQQEGAAMEEMAPEEVEQWSLSGAVVASYLAEVCGLEGIAG